MKSILLIGNLECLSGRYPRVCRTSDPDTEGPGFTCRLQVLGNAVAAYGILYILFLTFLENVTSSVLTQDEKTGRAWCPSCCTPCL